MNNYLTELQQALDFYRRNGGMRADQRVSLQGGGYASQGGELVPGLLFAQGMAGRMGGGGGSNPPDFFDEPQQNVLRDYVRPEMRSGSMPPRQSMDRPRRVMPDTSMSGRADNYLARMMGGR